ncbi:hypothetical protein [Lactococcus sp. DD01]|uniref:hypothetical protein n=1 Tax=Lactococcus sp. DD01 TaxID=1776443 RepID=UPI000AFE846B|nr:hypothetical protein [Lactococcus sp. DD01]
MTKNEEIKMTIVSENEEVEFDFKNGKTEDYLTLLWQAIHTISLQEGIDPSDVLSQMFHREVQLKYLD